MRTPAICIQEQVQYTKWKFSRVFVEHRGGLPRWREIPYPRTSFTKGRNCPQTVEIKGPEYICHKSITKSHISIGEFGWLHSAIQITRRLTCLSITSLEKFHINGIRNFANQVAAFIVKN